MVAEKRLNGNTITRPFIIGTYAFMLSQNEISKRKSRNDSATHQWTCILRAADNSDTSSYIKKVTFTLHPSFAVSQRTIEIPPYEVTEVGWGEFDISAKVYFVDPVEKPVEVNHLLKLYDYNTVDIRAVKPLTDTRGECVATETLNEFIFHCPTESMYEALVAPVTSPPIIQYGLQKHFLDNGKKVDEYLNKVVNAREVIQRIISEKKKTITDISKEIQYYRTVWLEANPDEAEALAPPSITGSLP
eukprot:GHVO01026940.1.p1 GENE.GHVO01026940.1~~GHVO01026940.1.p1  ORF type:complete len:246 (+),score=54.17 GHVO01026940.1:43-780(+)